MNSEEKAPFKPNMVKSTGDRLLEIDNQVP